jgi:hypothetical protein
MKCLHGVASLQSGPKRNLAPRMFGDLWCRVMHSAIRWPVHGSYVCATCGRLYPVPWANPETVSHAGTRRDAPAMIR